MTHELKILAAKHEAAYLNDADGSVPDVAPSLAVLERTGGAALPLNPFTRKPTQPLLKSSKQLAGNFLYLVAHVQGQYTDNVIVGFGRHVPGLTRRQLVFIGGECGNNKEYFATGLSCSEVIDQLRKLLQEAYVDDSLDFHSPTAPIVYLDVAFGTVQP